MVRFFALVTVLLVAGCAAPSGPSPSPTTLTPTEEVAAEWTEHAFLGSILTDGAGRTLYVFLDDRDGAIACTGDCASGWPPAPVQVVPSAEGALAARLSAVSRPEGAQQLAIDGRPLYRFADDAKAGDANGQGRAGKWFVVRESDLPGQRNVDFLDGPGEHDVTGANVTYGPGAQGFLARPSGNGSFPGVVMVHEWWGLNEHIRAMALALASHGYAVLAVDLFEGSVAQTPDEALAQVRALSQDEATATLRAAAAYLREEAGAPRVASLGWCFGGGQALRLALSGEPLAATVIYYGQLDTNETNLSAIEWPVLGVFGAEDASIPVERVLAFEAALANLSIEKEIHIYEGVGHAFANPSGDAYAPEKAMEAWARTLAFLERTLNE